MRPTVSSPPGHGSAHGSRSQSSFSQPSVASTDGSSYQTRPSTDDSQPSYGYNRRQQQPGTSDSKSWTPSTPTRMAASASRLIQTNRSIYAGGARAPSPTYRPDYSRSQHATLPDTQRTYAASDVGGAQPYPSPDHARFSAYVNRFASHDPRTSPAPVVALKSPKSSSRTGGKLSDRIHRFQVAPLQRVPTDEVQSLGGSEQQPLRRVPTDELQPSGSFGHGQGEPAIRPNEGPASPVHSSQQHHRGCGSSTNKAARDPLGRPAPHQHDGTESPRPIPPSPRQRRQERLANAQGRRFQPVTPENSLPQRGREAVYGKHIPEESRVAEPVATSRYMASDTSRGSIETPSLTRVQDLKKQLWDGDETLQVQVQPSLHAYGETRPFNRHWLHFNGPEMAGNKGERTARSLSPDRRPYRRSGKSSADPPPSTTSDIAQPFKSKFYEAAIAAQRSGMQSTALPNQPHKARSQPSSPRRPEWRSSTDRKPSSPTYPVDRAQSSSGSGTAENTVAKLVAKLSSIDRENPAAALAKIDSILRAESFSNSSSGNPSEQELRVKVTLTAGPPPDPTLFDDEMPRRSKSDGDEHQQGGGEEEATESDSDDETSVSSITNPTYQSRHLKDSRGALEQNKSTANFRRPRPSSLQGYSSGHIDRARSPLQEEWRGKSSSKSRKVRSPPPTTIEVSKTTEVPESTGGNSDTSMHATMSGRAKKLDSFMSSQAALGMTRDDAAAIALKIRLWDEMSSPSLSNRSIGAPDEETTGSTELGSIVTPSQKTPVESASGAPSPSRRSHPWDTYHKRASTTTKEPLETSMWSGTGMEVPVASPQPTTSERARERTKEYGNGPSFFGDDFDMDPQLVESKSSTSSFDMPTSGRLKAHRVETKSLSDDYDSAWVALPPSSFFSDKKRSTSKNLSTSLRLPTESAPSLPEDVAAAFSTEIDLKDAAPPIKSFVSEPEQEMEPPVSGRVERGRKPRRGFLKSVLRKKGGTPKASSEASSASRKPDPAKTKSKSLLSAYAMDSVAEDEESKRRNRRRFSRSRSPGRRRSKSPFARQRPSWDEDDTEETASLESARSRNSRLAQKLSRFMKVYD